MSRLRTLLFAGIILAIAVPLVAFVPYHHFGWADISISGSSVSITGHNAKIEDLYVEFCDGTKYYQRFRPWKWPPRTWDLGKPIAYADSFVKVRFGNHWFKKLIYAYGECWSAHKVIPKMLLYTSDAGFFTADDGGVVNTCSIISESPASKERITALCGSVPEDINLTCGGPVWQETPGDVRGHWDCDRALESYGETRLDLFGPEGGLVKGTLYWVYQEHLKHLAGE